MKDLLAPMSNSSWHSVTSNSLPEVYPCSDIVNDSSAFNLCWFSLSTLPKCVMLKSELSSNLLELTISEWIPSYMSMYSSCNFCGIVPKANSLNSLLSVLGLCLYLFTALISNVCFNWMKYTVINKLFSLRVNYEDEKCSTKQDWNLHPSVSGQVPLPLDHLHYFLFLSFSS